MVRRGNPANRQQNAVLLIATDEAGYGPKLGPLVVAATAWAISSEAAEPSNPGGRSKSGTARSGATVVVEPDAVNAGDDFDAAFAGLRQPVQIGKLKIKVDDSKAVFKPGGGLAVLHAVVSASHHWCGRQPTDMADLLTQIAADDLAAIQQTPWFSDLGDEAFLATEQTSAVIQSWQSAVPSAGTSAQVSASSPAATLHDVQARVLTAAEFNRRCQRGYNKADLLSETTIGLVRDMIARHGDGVAEIHVHCDRHGGRRYYSGVLQHVFPDAQVQVRTESKGISAYRMTLDRGGQIQTVEIDFKVKGDSFTPVALASMHAKYLRERMMNAFNAYFAGHYPPGQVYRPTAGYPVDADRFLQDAAATIRRLGIDNATLVRSR
ncbi:hypothetical protein [Rubripirellula lacrimiformis]|nr:hypothetical protein [Rubripirellula lacrimiformis]